MKEGSSAGYYRTRLERSLLGVPGKKDFSNPGKGIPVILIKGKYHRWSEDGLSLIELDQRHQMEARQQESSGRREVVIKQS